MPKRLEKWVKPVEKGQLKTEPEKENLLEGILSEFVDKFGEENLKNLLLKLKEDGGRALSGARIENRQHLYGAKAAMLDAVNRVLTGKNLFSGQDKDFITEQENRHFLTQHESSITDAIDELVYHIVRTGENPLVEAKQKNQIKQFIEEKFELAFVQNRRINEFQTLELAKNAAFWRIFTGESPGDLMAQTEKSLTAKRHPLRNKITEKTICESLEKEIIANLNERHPSLAFDKIAAYAILKAKKISIVPDEGVIFPK